MTILYVISGSVMGGATHSVLSLIAEMKKRGNRVVVASPDMNDFLREKLDLLRVRWYIAPICFKSYPRKNRNIAKWLYALIKMVYTDALAVRFIRKIIEIEHIDLVHTNVGPVTCGYEACRKLGIPHVWHIREYGDLDFEVRMFPSKAAFKRSLSNSFVISITKDLLRYNQLEESPTTAVIYNGVRKRAEIRFENPRDHYFLCASRVSPEKGFDQIIRVFAKMNKLFPDFHLIILGLGDKKYKEMLIDSVISLNIQHNVRFEGYKENVTDYMAKATALLVASPHEGFGRMTAEAAFAGCLVIGKNTAGTKEVMDIIGGYPFLTDEEMLNAMVSVINLSSMDYKSKALDAQKKAIHYFSEEMYVERVCNMYDSIIEKQINHC